MRLVNGLSQLWECVWTLYKKNNSLILILAFICGVYSQPQGPNVLDIIYHDHYAAHPDFTGEGEAGQQCNDQKNVVQGTLDANRNLVQSPTHPNASCQNLQISTWFSETNAWGTRTFEGQLVDDTPNNPGLFTYDDQTFYPLDTVGAGEFFSNGHNNLFCIEAHTRFRYDGGEVFNFRGDDDVWVFIDNRIVVDLGGVHTPRTQNVNLDTMGFTVGQFYNFDFFYCERQFSGSSIRIESNIEFLSGIGDVGFDPESTSFPYQQSVNLIGDLDADVFYKIDNGPWTLYSNTAILVDKTSTISAYQQRRLYQTVISDTLPHTYTHVPPNSQLEITKVNGEDINGNGKFLTELDNNFRVTVKVFYANTRMNTLTLNVKSGNDIETITLSNPAINADAQVFTGLINLGVGHAGVNSDGNVQTKYYDSVSVSWSNLLKPSDQVSGGFLTRPAEKASKIYFATDATGNTQLDTLSGSTNTLFIVVEDQVIDSSILSSYKVTVVNIPGVANSQGADQVIVQLSELSPGKYIATLQLQNLAPNVADGILQAILGDQIQASYTDPKNAADISQVQKGLGVASEINGTLFFVDKLGNRILRSDTTTWPLTEDSVYLRYIDDPGNGWSKKVFITASRPLELPPVSDTATFTLVHRGDSVWEAGIPITDSKVINPNNQIMDIFFLGNLVAIVSTHRNNVSVETLDGRLVSAVINVAYPDQTASVVIVDKNDPTDQVDRETELVQVCVTDQIFSVHQIDTLVLKELTCENSLDKITNLKLIQQAGNPNQYCGSVAKNEETVDVNDAILTCRTVDIIEAKYEDPVYGGQTKVDVQWNYNIKTKLEILSITNLPVTTDIESPLGNKYKIRMTAPDSILSNPNETKTVLVTSYNEIGLPTDNIQVVLTEVGKDTNGAAIFEGTVNAKFEIDQAKFDGAYIEGLINGSSVLNAISIIAEGDGVNSQPVALFASYIKSEQAWIEDSDGDGTPDQIKVVFAKPTGILPSSIPVIQWPDNTENTSAPGTLIKYDGTSFDTIVVNFNPSSPFIPNSTVAGQGANLVLPDDIYFRGVRLPLEDRVKPVAISGEVREGNEVRTVIVNGEDSSFYAPDTIQITLSEPIKKLVTDGSDVWNRLFCYEKICGDLECLPLKFLGEPNVDDESSKIWTGEIEEGGITEKSCIRMMGTAQYSDLNNNLPAEKEISPTVKQADLSFTDADVLFPVAGIPNTVKNFDNTPGYSFNIIPSYGVAPNGIQDLNFPCNPNVGRNQQIMTVDNQCLSVVRLETNRNEGYVAQIRIYDHLGKFINSSVQQFGVCGELDDARRVTKDGRLRSYLIWDLKDVSGNRVGNGVYIWKIDYFNVDGTPSNMKQDILKQGVAQKGITDPITHCSQPFTPYP